MIQYRELEWQIRRLEVLRRVVNDRIVSEAGLQRGRLPILEYIQMHEGRPQKEIAEMLHITPASIAVTARRMENDGLVRRETDSVDRRITRIYSTQLGRDKVQMCRIAHEKTTAQLFSGFTAKELAAMHATLERLFSNLSGTEYADFSITPMHIENLIAAEEETDA